MSKPNKARVFSLKNTAHDFVWLTGAPVVFWQRPKIIYTSEKAKEKIRGGALLIANHTGIYDPVYMMLGVPYRRQFFIISEEVMDKPVGALFKACRCIRIDRNNPNLATFREIIARLKSGEVISMFPEGHISHDDSTSQFKSGMVLMAVRSGVRVSVTELYGEHPTFAQIDAATKLLYERETELSGFIN